MDSVLAQVECNEMQCCDPSHDRVVAARLMGKRWSEIAHDLGIRPETLWRWRQECPHIEERVAHESADYLESARHALLSLLPKATLALNEIASDPDHKDRHAASKTIIEMFRRQDGKASDMTPGGIVARLRGAERLPDGELDAAIHATVIERSKPR